MISVLRMINSSCRVTIHVSHMLVADVVQRLRHARTIDPDGHQLDASDTLLLVQQMQKEPEVTEVVVVLQRQTVGGTGGGEAATVCVRVSVAGFGHGLLCRVVVMEGGCWRSWIVGGGFVVGPVDVAGRAASTMDMVAVSGLERRRGSRDHGSLDGRRLNVERGKYRDGVLAFMIGVVQIRVGKAGGPSRVEQRETHGSDDDGSWAR
ncbi:hypothetical protein BKA62DRAFT_716803 [Auriculariales sp. MPI-PUGE-AT-0066]|nr:hypothetical protein BKA62DRAFT_716803 [Auriculariales sp. MPI-PUGE-AT-0066]